MARVRKALVAGLGAGVAAAIGALVQSGSMTQDEITKAIGLGVAAALTVGLATWGVPNKA